MQPRVASILPSATVREAVEKMVAKGTNGLVVVDAENKPVGILSTWDIIRYLVPEYLEKDKHLASFEPESLFMERALQSQNDAVEKFMSSPVHTCKETHSIMEVATLLSEFNIRQLPIVNDDGVVVGYISRTNVKKAIADVLGIV